MSAIFTDSLDNAIKILIDDNSVKAFFNSDKGIKNLSHEQKKDVAFILFAVSNILDLAVDESFKTLTDGNMDKGIDAVFIKNISDTKVEVHFFNVKNPKSPESSIKESEVEKVQNFIDHMSSIKTNTKLKTKINQIEEIKKDSNINGLDYVFHFITNGCFKENEPLPNSLKILSQNGDCCFTYDAKKLCDISFLNKDDKKSSQFCLDIVSNSIEDIYEINGNKIKGFIVNITVETLIKLYNAYDNIFEHNVRSDLQSRINKNIVLSAEKTPELFWFFNNGITIICDTIDSQCNKMKKINITNPKIINGCQTTSSLVRYFKNNSLFSENQKKIKILTRLYNFDSINEKEELMEKVIVATNNQNPIILKDLKSRNLIQRLVQKYFLDRSVYLEIRRGEFGKNVGIVKNDTVMQFYVSIYEGNPAQAKTGKTACFNKYFDKVFHEDNKNLSSNFFNAYLIRNFILDKINNASDEDESFLENGDLTISRCMVLFEEKLKNDFDLKLAEESYKKSIGIIKDVVNETKGFLGEKFSYNNFFKNNIFISKIEDKINATN